MLAFAALTPHPLAAVPDIGKEHLGKLRATMKAYRELSNELYAAKPDIVIIISPHAAAVEGVCSINQRPEVRVSFRSLGNLSDAMTLTNDIGFGYSIRESLETHFPVILTEQEELDYGSSIPLWHIIPKQKEQLRVVPIGTSQELSLQQHYTFGIAIKRCINLTNKRVTVIASGDLSHGATKHAPGGYISAAASFNTTVRDLVVSHNTEELLNISLDAYPGVSECALRPLALLLGILHEKSYTPKTLSFETPLGVGCLTVYMEIR